MPCSAQQQPALQGTAPAPCSPQTLSHVRTMPPLPPRLLMRDRLTTTPAASRWRASAACTAPRRARSGRLMPTHLITAPSLHASWLVARREPKQRRRGGGSCANERHEHHSPISCCSVESGSCRHSQGMHVCTEEAGRCAHGPAAAGMPPQARRAVPAPSTHSRPGSVQLLVRTCPSSGSTRTSWQRTLPPQARLPPCPATARPSLTGPIAFAATRSSMTAAAAMQTAAAVRRPAAVPSSVRPRPRLVAAAAAPRRRLAVRAAAAEAAQQSEWVPCGPAAAAAAAAAAAHLSTTSPASPCSSCHLPRGAA